MDLRWSSHRRDLYGTVVVVLEGNAQAQLARSLAEEILELAKAEDADRLELNLAHCTGDLDAMVVTLLRELRGHRSPEVALTGLTQHQLRLLGYLGFGAPSAAPHE